MVKSQEKILLQKGRKWKIHWLLRLRRVVYPVKFPSKERSDKNLGSITTMVEMRLIPDSNSLCRIQKGTPQTSHYHAISENNCENHTPGDSDILC